MGLEHLSRDEDHPLPTDQTVAEGGGTLEMAGDLTREELAAHLAAADARTDTMFERLLGEMRAGFAQIEGSVSTRFAETKAKLEAKPSITQLWAVMGTAAGLALAMVGVIFTSVKWLDARRAEQAALQPTPAVHGPVQP